MTPEAEARRRQKDHERYIEHREARIKAAQDYQRDYKNKGLRKPRKQGKPKSWYDRHLYIEHQEERKAHQRAYYAAHREEILRRRRERGPMKVVIH
jgi:hypothetical protein